MKNLSNRPIIALLITVFLSCSRDDGPPPDEAFEDLNDFTTTAIETTIPRVELSQSGNNLMALVSVTDQDGKPLEKFKLGNYEIEMIIGSNTSTVAKNTISLTELNEQSNTKPLAAATTLDYSGSMSSQDVRDMEEALMTFIGLKDINDQLSVIKFGSSVEQVQGFTTDNTLLNSAINTNTSVGSSTAFYSACELGLEEAAKITDVLPLVIGFTDGKDNRSNITLTGLISKSQTLGIPVYTIGFGNAQQSTLQQLADDTGGRFYYAPNGQEISDLYEVINGQLKRLYILNWNIDIPSNTEVTIKITTEYTAANGTFTDVSFKTLTIQ